jgi:hypothetical protein
VVPVGKSSDFITIRSLAETTISLVVARSLSQYPSFCEKTMVEVNSNKNRMTKCFCGMIEKRFLKMNQKGNLIFIA